MPKAKSRHSKSLRSRLLKEIAGVVPGVLGTCIPKKKDLVVAGAWKGTYFADNPKYLALELHRREFLVCWIAGSRAARDQARDSGLRAYTWWQPRGWWNISRARIWVYSHAPSDISPGPFFRTRRANLTHGIPLKRIWSQSQAGRVPSRFRKLVGFARRQIPRDTVVFTASKESAKRLELSQDDRKVPVPVHASGYSRWEPLERGKGGCDVRTVLYAPTHRMYGTREFDIGKIPGFIEFGEWASAQGIALLFRGHASQELTLGSQGLDFWKQVDFDSYPDSSSLLPNVDVVISDYSGIFYDFAIYRDRLIFLAPDLDEYIAEDQGIYPESYEAEVPGPVVRDWGSVRRHIEEDSFCDSAKLREFRAIHGEFGSLDMIDSFLREMNLLDLRKKSSG